MSAFINVTKNIQSIQETIPEASPLISSLIVPSPFTFDVFSLALEAVQREDDAAHQHVGVHQRTVDLRHEGLELQERNHERRNGAGNTRTKGRNFHF